MRKEAREEQSSTEYSWSECFSREDNESLHGDLVKLGFRPAEMEAREKEKRQLIEEFPVMRREQRYGQGSEERMKKVTEA